MSESEGRSLFGSIFFTHLVLVLHALVIVLVALLVVFFRGVVEYMTWIVIGGFALLALVAALIWIRVRRSRRELAELLQSPILRDRAVEIRLLGGLASVKLGEPVIQHQAAGPALDYQPTERRLELVEPERESAREACSNSPPKEQPPEDLRNSERVIDLAPDPEDEDVEAATETAEPIDTGEAERLRAMARLVKQRESGELDEAAYLEQKRQLDLRSNAGWTSAAD